jgi:hypothetical protein
LVEARDGSALRCTIGQERLSCTSLKSEVDRSRLAMPHDEDDEDDEGDEGDDGGVNSLE